MKKITSFFSKRSLAEQSSSEPPFEQPIINQGEDSDENSDDDSQGCRNRGGRRVGDISPQ